MRGDRFRQCPPPPPGTYVPFQRYRIYSSVDDDEGTKVVSRHRERGFSLPLRPRDDEFVRPLVAEHLGAGAKHVDHLSRRRGTAETIAFPLTMEASTGGSTTSSPTPAKTKRPFVSREREGIELPSPDEIIDVGQAGLSLLNERGTEEVSR